MKMDLEVGHESEGLMKLVLNKVKQRTLLNTVMHLGVA
jgi:phosphoribosylformylglycinamidine (FGAM) synthase PurS component